MSEAEVDAGRRRVRVAALVGFVVAMGVIGVIYLTITPPEPGAKKPGFAALYMDNATKADLVLVRGDGQAYATLAQDPLLTDQTTFLGNRATFAYFANRPLFPFLGWVLSGGQPALVPLALSVVVALGTAATMAGAVTLVQEQYPDRRALWALGILLLPGSLTGIVWVEPGMLGLAFAMWGVVWWLRGPSHRWLAVGLFVGAVLARETMVLVPIALALHGLVVRRERLRTFLPLFVVPAVMLAWSQLVRWRVGVGPERFGMHQNIRPPFVGLVDGFTRWELQEWAVFVLAALLFGLLIARHRRDLCTWIALAFLAFSMVAGAYVWETWEGFGRVFLPAFAFGLLPLLPVRDAAAEAASVQPAGL